MFVCNACREKLDEDLTEDEQIAEDMIEAAEEGIQ